MKTKFNKLEWYPTAGPMSWGKAMSYAKSLGSSWRLPTIAELKKAHETGVPGFEPSYYWSEEYQPGNNYVRCVRGQQAQEGRGGYYEDS